MADERAWDSPARRTSVSGSPVTRFGGGSLFGGRDRCAGAFAFSLHYDEADVDMRESSSTPSKSPKFAPYTAPPRASAYKHEVEEDAPPVASLNEFDSGDQSSLQADSNMNGCARLIQLSSRDLAHRAARPPGSAARPPTTPLPLPSPLLPLSRTQTPLTHRPRATPSTSLASPPRLLNSSSSTFLSSARSCRPRRRPREGTGSRSCTPSPGLPHAPHARTARSSAGFS